MLSASLIQLEYASKHWRSNFSYSLLVCLPTLPMVWAHLPLRFLRQLLPVNRWPPVLRGDGMRLIITILYPLRGPMWMFLGMQP